MQRDRAIQCVVQCVVLCEVVLSLAWGSRWLRSPNLIFVVQPETKPAF